MKKYRYYLFDYDLTLVDTIKGIDDSMLYAILKHPEIEGYDKVTNEQVTAVIGMSLEDGFKKLLPAANEDMISILVKEYMLTGDEYMLKGSTMYPDTIDTLKHIKDSGAKIALVSLKHRKFVEEGMNGFGLSEFVDIVVAADDVTEPKPSPQAITIAMKKLGAEDKSNVIYIGDSLFDAGSAKNAGVDFAGVTTGTTSREELESYPHVKIMDSLAEL